MASESASSISSEGGAGICARGRPPLAGAERERGRGDERERESGGGESFSLRECGTESGARREDEGEKEAEARGTMRTSAGERRGSRESRERPMAAATLSLVVRGGRPSLSGRGAL
eukprot:scaffold81886_cov26-Tisochrysis_lutea.AAC.2